MFCKQCGSEVAEGTKFCPNCGTACESKESKESNQVNYDPSCVTTTSNGNSGWCVPSFLAIGGFVCALLGFVLAIVGIIGFVLSIISLVMIKRTPGAKGKGFAVAGIVIGAIILVLILFVVIAGGVIAGSILASL